MASRMEDSNTLGLEGGLAEEWQQFTASLKHNAIRQKDDEDEIILSKNRASRMLIAKLGYEVLVEENVEGEKKWWWKVIWKLSSPLKSRILLWMVLSNNVLT